MVKTAGRMAEPQEQAPAGMRQWVGLGVVLSATFLSMVDMFIVNVASPSIQGALDASFGQVQFVIDGYIIAYAAGLVLGGRLGDIAGRKRMFQLGLVGFVLTSLLCGLAPAAGWLIGARVLQGAAAAMLLPQVLATVQATFHGADRRRAVSAWGVVIGLGVIAGLAGGGFLLHLDLAGLGWRVIFLVNLPLGVAALLCSGPTLKDSRSPRRPGLDPVGAALTGAALPALLLPLASGPSRGWPPWTWASLAAAAGLGAGFFAYEGRLARRGADPLVPPRLLRQPRFAVSMAIVLAFYSGNAGLFLVLAYHLQCGLQLDPLAAGLVFAALGAGFAFASLAGQRIAPRHDVPVLITGAGVMAASLLAIPLVLRGSPNLQPELLAATVGISGVGQGLVAARLIAAVLAQLDRADVGAGVGVLNTATQIAMALGVVVIGTTYRAQLGRNPHHSTHLDLQNYETAFTTAVTLLAALAIATGALAWTLGRCPLPGRSSCRP